MINIYAMITHLIYNHYPSLPSVMALPCIKAVEYAKRGDWNHRIILPKGVYWGGKRTISVADAFEYHDLDCFL